MKYLLLLFFVGILFSSYSHIQTTEWIAPAWADTLKNPVAYNDDAIAKGKKIYNQACWSCHGQDGKGTGPAAAALNPKPADHTSSKVQQESDGAIYWKLTYGRGKMQPYQKVFESKLRWDLVNYIRFLGKQQSVSEK